MNMIIKRKTSAIVIFLTLLIFTFTTQSFSDEAASFLNRTIGAKAGGLGGAFVSVADDATSSSFNPAGILNLKSTSIATMTADLQNDTKHNFVGIVCPIGKKQAIGLSYIGYNDEEIRIWNIATNQLQTISDKNNAYTLSYGRSFGEKTKFGLNFKLIKQKLFTSSADGNAFDIGILHSFDNGLNLGISAQNISGKLKWNTASGRSDKIPLNIKAGMSYKFLNEKLLLAFDVDNRKNASTILHTGAEYLIVPNVALRFGYDDKNFTGGIGFNISNFALDYAYMKEELGNVQKVAFIYNFGGKEKIKKVEEPVKKPEVVKKEEKKDISKPIIEKKIVEEKPKEKIIEKPKEVEDVKPKEKVSIKEKPKEEIKVEKKKEEIVKIDNAPEIKVIKPLNNKTVRKNFVVVEAVITDDNKVDEIMINKKALVFTPDKIVNIKHKVNLILGKNIIKITVKDNKGQIKEEKIVVQYKKPVKKN